MKSLEDLLNDRLEHLATESAFPEQPSSSFLPSHSEQKYNREIDDLVALARSFQQTPQLQVRPDFARQLERRITRHQAELRLQQSHAPRSWFARLRVHPVLSSVLALCFLFCVLSTSVLAMAAQVTDPTNPFYVLKQWERHVQTQLSGNPTNQATLDLQFAREQLNALSSLVGATHEDAYQQALLNLDQQLHTATSAIHALPAGSTQDDLRGELAGLQTRTIQTLHLLLPKLTLPERLATTAELARLGESVPLLARATLTLPLHPNGRAIISLQGQHLTAGAQLLVNGRLVKSNGTLQENQMTFVVNWNGASSPQSLGVLNPDGTAAQTTTITIVRTAATGNAGDTPTPNSTKPVVTPTPNSAKPIVTPTPNGHKPTVTPTPHH